MPDGSFQPQHASRIVPGPETQKDLRRAFGQFATGVTVVTAQTDTGPVGMTANSFSSVSLDPALVMWCPAKSSSRYAGFAAASHFAIHVLGAEQEEMALGFARRGDAFDGLDLRHNGAGVPLLQNCLARFECRTHALHDAGDHAIVLGAVEMAEMRPGAPLIFCQGAFRAFDKGPQ